jgi:Terminase small subunit
MHADRWHAGRAWHIGAAADRKREAGILMGKQPERGAGTSKAEAKAARELQFADLYVANGSIGAKAYLQAGYRAKNANVAAVMANRLLRNPKIAALIKERTQKRLEAAKLEADDAIKSLAYDVKFDPAKLFNEDGSRKELHEIDEATRMALRGEVGKDGAIKFKFPEKTAAREQLMKHLGLFKPDNAQKPQGVVKSRATASLTPAMDFRAFLRLPFRGIGLVGRA